MQILFWLFKARSNSAGTCPLMCRITVDGVRSDFSTSIRLRPVQWSAKKQRFIGASDEAQIVNQKIAKIKNDLEKVRMIFESRDEIYSTADILDVYQGRKKFEYTVKEIYERYIDYVLSFQGTDESLSQGTIRNWLIRLATFQEFLGVSGNLNLYSSRVSGSFSEAFRFWMMKDKGFKRSHAVRQLSSLKTVFSWAVGSGLTKVNPFLGVDVSQDTPSDPTYLDQDELFLIENYCFRVEKLERVRDLFLFQCYTGLSYADLESFSSENLIEFQDRICISKDREKSLVYFFLPLLKKPAKILEKYGGADSLPVISNAKYNLYLKEVAEVVGIDKRITTHVARKTFGFMALNEWNIPIETVSRMLGHTDIRTTQKIYAKVLREKVARDMGNIE